VNRFQGILLTDPWTILDNSNLPTEIADLDLGGLIYAITTGTTIVCFVVCVVTLIAMMLLKESKALGEAKQKIEHKLIIACLASGVIGFFAALKTILDWGFRL